MKTITKTFIAALFIVLISATSFAQEPAEGNTLVISAVINKENKAKLPEYLGKMKEVFKEFEGTPVGKYKRISIIDGDATPEMIAIIEFPNQEAITNMIESDSYQGLSDLRESVFSELSLSTYAKQN